MSDARTAPMTHDEQVAELIALVSHDLRGPLTAVLLGSRLVGKQDASSEATRQVAREIEDAAEDLERRILDWLDLSRSLHAALEVSPVPIDLGEVAEGVVLESRRKAALREQTLRLSARPVVVRGDRRLPRLLHAMVAQAMHHAPPGSAISVVVEERDSGGVASVADEGGVLSNPEHAFDAFDRAAGARQVGGIGLALAAAVTSALGGKVWASSPPGGAALHLWLPLAP